MDNETNFTEKRKWYQTSFFRYFLCVFVLIVVVFCLFAYKNFNKGIINDTTISLDSVETQNKITENTDTGFVLQDPLEISKRSSEEIAIYNANIDSEAIRTSNPQLCDQKVEYKEFVGFVEFTDDPGDGYYTHTKTKLVGNCYNNYAKNKGDVSFCRKEGTLNGSWNYSYCVTSIYKSHPELLTNETCGLLVGTSQYGDCLYALNKKTASGFSLSDCLAFEDESKAFPACIIEVIKLTKDPSICDKPEVKKAWERSSIYTCEFESRNALGGLSEDFCKTQGSEWQFNRCIESIVDATDNFEMCDTYYERPMENTYCKDKTKPLPLNAISTLNEQFKK